LELSAYLFALSFLPPRRAPQGPPLVAVDAGTGDGGMLEALAPVFGQVVAVDRSGVQLERCRARVRQRGFHTVRVVEGELSGPEVHAAVGPRGADVVVCARVLHHAPRPAEAVKGLVSLLRRDGAGALLVLDYERHEDEALRAHQADLWLGFEAPELVALAREAGLPDAEVHSIPQAWCGDGPDRHLPWHVLVASGRPGASDRDSHRSPGGDPSHDKASTRRRP
jgi:ArsR family transcriptional regulator